MPARVIQRIEHVPRDEWCPLCLECGWVGHPGVDLAECAKNAYTHNLERHDGAGIEPRLEDFAPNLDGQMKHYRRMFRHSMAMVVFGIFIVTVLSTMGGDGFLYGFAIGMNAAVAILQGFMAGKWAVRLEECQFKQLTYRQT